MNSPFANPIELNPFQNLKEVPVYVTPAPVVVVQKVVKQVVVNDHRMRWLEVPGACCLSYFCGPCYMFANLCCMIFRR